MICPNCGSEVMGGKFCEKCGSALSGNNNVNVSDNQNVCPNCGTPSNGGKFCEKCGTPLQGAETRPFNKKSSTGFFDNISNQINKTASSMLSIKSDYNNGNVIYKVSKIPAVKEKTIKIEDYEMVYFNTGNGFMKYNQTFQTANNNFLCFYIKNVTFINNNFNVETKTKIKKLDTDDILNIRINYIMNLKIDDIDKFFNTFMNIRQDTWKEVDVNSHLSQNIKGIIDKNTIEMLENDGYLDLRDPKAQITKFADKIKQLIANELSSYGLIINTFSVNNVNVDVNEVNRILINNLYNDA